MVKVVFNTCFGGFGLSKEAEDLYHKLSGKEFDEHSVFRHDRALVEVVDILGVRANGKYAKLAIRDIPKGGRYFIDEYDGRESVIEPEDIRWIIAE